MAKADPVSIDVELISEQEAARRKAEKSFLFGRRQALLSEVDHLERYMRELGFLGGPTTSEYRRIAKASLSDPTSSEMS